MRSALKIPAFRRLALGYTLNELLDWMATVALGDPRLRRDEQRARDDAPLFLAAKFLPSLVVPVLAARAERIAGRRGRCRPSTSSRRRVRRPLGRRARPVAAARSARSRSSTGRSPRRARASRAPRPSRCSSPPACCARATRCSTSASPSMSIVGPGARRVPRRRRRASRCSLDDHRRSLRRPRARHGHHPRPAARHDRRDALARPAAGRRGVRRVAPRRAAARDRPVAPARAVHDGLADRDRLREGEPRRRATPRTARCSPAGARA